MNLYRKQQAQIRVAGTLSRGFRIKRHGCILSAYLFNILADVMMRETLERYEGGMHMCGPSD